MFTGKHLCWGFFLIKLQAFRPATFSKRDSNIAVSCGYCEIFKNSFFTEHLWWLFLKVLPHYSKISWGACSLISRIHVLSILIKNVHKTLHKWFLTVTWQYGSFFAWIDLSRASDFRIHFWKTLVPFDFTEKLTQSVAQSTI